MYDKMVKRAQLTAIFVYSIISYVEYQVRYSFNFAIVNFSFIGFDSIDYRFY